MTRPKAASPWALSHASYFLTASFFAAGTVAPSAAGAVFLAITGFGFLYSGLASIIAFDGILICGEKANSRLSTLAMYLATSWFQLMSFSACWYAAFGGVSHSAMLLMGDIEINVDTGPPELTA